MSKDVKPDEVTYAWVTAQFRDGGWEVVANYCDDRNRQQQVAWRVEDRAAVGREVADAVVEFPNLRGLTFNYLPSPAPPAPAPAPSARP